MRKPESQALLGSKDRDSERWAPFLGDLNLGHPTPLCLTSHARLEDSVCLAHCWEY